MVALGERKPKGEASPPARARHLPRFLGWGFGARHLERSLSFPPIPVEMLQRALPLESSSQHTIALSVLDNTDINSCTPLALLDYARKFAALCRDLHQQRPKPCAAPIWFTFEDNKTNSYWLHMAFVCYKLGAVMQLYLASQIGFEHMLASHNVQSRSVPNLVQQNLVQSLRETIGVISWMLRDAQNSSLYVQEWASKQLEKAEESFHALRAWTLWLIAGAKQNSICLEELDLELRREVCKLYKTCGEIIANHGLQRFPAMQELHNDCQRQILANRGDYWAFDKGDIGQAVPCYLAARKLNWTLTESAERIVRLNTEHLQRKVVPQEMLLELEPFAHANHDLLVQGATPFDPALVFSFKRSP